MNLSTSAAAQFEENVNTKKDIHTCFAESESSDSADSDQGTEGSFGQNVVDRRLSQKSRKRLLEYGDDKKLNGIRNNIVMKYIYFRSTKHLTCHRKCPIHLEQIKNRSGILYGVHKLLTKCSSLQKHYRIGHLPLMNRLQLGIMKIQMQSRKI